MEHKVVNYTNEELIIRTDENKLVKLILIDDNGEDLVVYSEFLNDDWIEYTSVFANDLLNVNNPFGVTFEDQMTIDYFTCSYFTHWYKSLIN